MDIWAKWSEHYKSLGIDSNKMCKDGIVNPEKYWKSSPRLLFILKEVNDWEGGDLRLLMKDGPKHAMAHSIARWSSAILYKDRKFSDINNFDEMKEALSRIAVINLKKISGKAQADMQKLSAYAFMDRHLLLQQIKEINPEQIIACGIFDILIWLLELTVDPESPGTKAVYFSDKEIPVIPWRHPVRVGKAEEAYNSFSQFYKSHIGK